MRKNLLPFSLVATTLATLAVPLCSANADAGLDNLRKILPTSLPQVGQVDERFQSYNVESVEVTGGKSLGERRGMEVTTSQADALTETWLSRADRAQSFYRNVRDKVAPGVPIWITEMAQTACGGDRWSSSFVDTFRYVDQLGRLAKQDVSIVFHNTLAASGYALIDDRTWLPRPNYWAALLWRRTMGTKVLDAGTNSITLHVYAHCQPGVSGGVTVVAVNLDVGASAALDLGMPARRFTLTAADGNNDVAALNGRRLALVGGKSQPGSYRLSSATA